MSDSAQNSDPGERMKSYLEKIAAGPKLSKDLTEAEAEDALSLVLNGQMSNERAAVFLIAARMKLETLEENIGYWQALDRTTIKQEAPFDRLLQISEAFDGFQRTPIFTFYTIPVLAEMGLPAYGHSALPLPPKFGITFEDMLVNHYGVSADHSLDQRRALLEKHGFGYISTRQTNPKLDALRSLRVEIVKRPMLATLEKMLMPLKANINYLATNYFHPGYEQSMLAVAERAGWNRALVGNGMEGSTLYGVHKTAKLFLSEKGKAVEQKSVTLADLLDSDSAKEISEAFARLKEIPATRENLAALGESALNGGDGPAAPLIAWQAASLLNLLGEASDPQAAYREARETLLSKYAHTHLHNYLRTAQSS